MQRFTKLICILLSALMLMSALSGCGEEETQSGEERFVVRASVCGALASLDPALNDDARAESLVRGALGTFRAGRRVARAVEVPPCGLRPGRTIWTAGSSVLRAAAHPTAAGRRTRTSSW